jgi:hypothetical protein
MREYIIYNKTDWNKGVFNGGIPTNRDTLVNGFKELDDSSFTFPKFSDYKNKINSDYAKVVTSKDENKIKLSVEKGTKDGVFDKEYFCKSFTKIFTEGKLEESSKVFRIHFNWSAYKTQLEETGSIVFKSEIGPKTEVILTNRSKIMIKNFNTAGKEDYVEVNKTGSNSIGNFASYINNDLRDFYLDYQIHNNKAHIKFSSNGYESEWYSFDFDGKEINELEFLLNANKDTNSIVNKELEIKNINIDGYQNELSYSSKVFDSKETNSEWKTLNSKGSFNTNYLLGYEADVNLIKIELYSSNDIEELNKKQGLKKEILISRSDYSKDSFEIIEELQDSVSELKGRFLKAYIYLSSSSLIQNEIEYLRFEYIPGNEIDESKPQQVDEITVSKVIGSSGGIIDTNSDFFNTRIYIPEGSLSSDTSITIKRIASKDNVFASDMIGFDLSPKGLVFNKPVLLEVDYNKFDFNVYQSEEGLRLGFIDNNEPEEFFTIIDPTNKKALAYVDKF